MSLGDSFSSGEGLGSYLDSTDCHRSSGAYAGLVAERFRDDFASFTQVACSGAVTNHLFASNRDGIPPQARSVDEGTELITLTIGGNDLGFAEILASCYATSALSFALPCAVTANGASRRVAAAADDVQNTLERLRRDAPNAEIILLGYPSIVPATAPGGGCDIFEAPELERATQYAEEFDAALATAAASAGVTYVSVLASFRGHDVCADDPWINPLVLGGDVAGLLSLASYHPNAAGHQAYAAALEPVVAAFVASR